MKDYHNKRRRLADILGGRFDEILKQLDSIEAAPDFVPLPAGAYEAHAQSVEPFEARTGTPGLKIEFCVCEGEHAGRKLFFDLWLTMAAPPQTKRGLAKLGLDSKNKLEDVTLVPGRIRCKVFVALRTDDSGKQFNRVRDFDVLGLDEPAADPFAPKGGES